MLQEPTLTSYTWQQWVFWLIAGVLGSGLTGVIATRWLYRRRLSAEVQQTDAATTKIRIEARVAEGDAIGRYMQWLQQAQERYDVLRGELTELQDQCANLINENRQLTTDLAQANTTIQLNEHYIAQLHAATKLGMELRDLPPSVDDIILMLEATRDKTDALR
jgi:chromosome segregation ATPase